MPRRTLSKTDLSLLLIVLVWGFNFPLLKAVLAVMHPHAMNVLRLWVSALVLGALYYRSQKRAGAALLAPLRARTLPILALGLLGYFVYQVAFIVGVDNTTAGSAALIMASAPLWTTLFSHFFRFDVLTPKSWGGLFVTLVGAVVVVAGSTKTIDFSNATFFGNVMMVGAALCWGAYTAFSKPLTRRIAPVAVTFLGLLVALPFLTALGLPYFAMVDWQAVSGWIWLAIIASGGLSTGLAVALWHEMVKRVGPSHTAAYGNLAPVVALFSGAWLLGEPILPAQLAGGALILGGLYVMRRTRRGGLGG